MQRKYAVPRRVSLIFACTQVSHNPGAAPSLRHGMSGDRSAMPLSCGTGTVGTGTGTGTGIGTRTVGAGGP